MVSLREYKDEDLEACQRLWVELTQWHRVIYEDNTIGGDDPGSYFDRHLAKAGKSNVYVAEENGRVVGLTSLILDGVEAEIEPVIVTKSRRGRGIGKRLINEMVAKAKRKGAVYVNVKPVARNIRAIKFFHRQGFNIVGHIHLFIDLEGKQWKKGLDIHGKNFRY